MDTPPRLILAGLSGGAGKTILSLGLCRALTDLGLRVQPFKKGPDYIDAAWLGLAARRETSNLDPFMMPGDSLVRLFLRESATADMALIEGNRGLFDGKDTSGSCSTAELARLLQTPVVLIINCTKMTRTVAALVLGCRTFEPNLRLAGVILNRTAGPRHKTILRQCIEQYTDVPVVGILPKIKPDPIPERHMGLVSDQECAEAETTLRNLAAIARDCLDIEAIRAIAASASAVPLPDAPTGSSRGCCFTTGNDAEGGTEPQTGEHESHPPKETAESALQPPRQGKAKLAPLQGHTVRIGVVRDAALWFYYRENLEELRRNGAELVELSLLTPAPWPVIHGLYLGGGFPETQAEQLAQNEATRALVFRLAGQGLPIYAECGGFMYLGQSLICREIVYPMAGVFPVQTMLCAKPQGHGYTVAKVIHPNPFHAVGLEFTGHEFHYSKCVTPLPPDVSFSLEMQRGSGIDQNRDGLVFRNTFACYTHLHALGVPTWAVNFVAAARRYRENGPESDQT
ncbi:cobyrinate a,c-diamide synthase [Desulfonatronum lacustre]|uniref:cobyrinate a,c-diamide synthase n=1 Tax=Desulfonatronum lacustre TaxID=66849 RepID=UPI0004902B3F|nr:cobyrinate a,c-diamide synthase [Desulfonatronum lacustre]